MGGYKVGHTYKAKRYLECGYNFPEGEYKIKEISDGFPTNPHEEEVELESAEEQWLEGYEDDEEEYDKLYKETWFCLEFPEGDHFEWIPKSVIKDVFTD